MEGVLLLPPLFKGRIKSLGDVRVGMTEQVQQREVADNLVVLEKKACHPQLTPLVEDNVRIHIQLSYHMWLYIISLSIQN